MDGVSDRPWPAQATGPLQALIRLANLEKAGRHEAADSVLYMDVEVDPRNGEQFELVVALSPFTTGAEGLDNSEKLIYSASDTGSGLWMALTPSEHSELREKLLARGVSPDAVIPQ
ncbi:hypothetical protein [Actinopolymorpha alba]|uniref:hypothetical protein n=1 Tax=Actinopolymorpha alba TaxID=533267 RepID=UPI0012F69BC6|nr:hypothetical protein [Actinopolymorpha alba]